MSLTAIIPHYWDSRRENLARIVNALRSGLVNADAVIIWNNTAEQLHVGGADVINAGHNWGVAARFAAAYLARTNYVLFQDNDLLVQPGTLRNMTRNLPPFGVSIELQGRMFGPDEAPYTRSEYLTNVQGPYQLVDVGLSRLSLMQRATAVALCEKIPPNVIDDDLFTSRYSAIHLISYGDGEGFTDIPETEGLSHDVSAHVQRRDEVVRRLWKKAGAA